MPKIALICAVGEKGGADAAVMSAIPDAGEGNLNVKLTTDIANAANGTATVTHRAACFQSLAHLTPQQYNKLQSLFTGTGAANLGRSMHEIPDPVPPSFGSPGVPEKSFVQLFAELGLAIVQPASPYRSAL